MTEERLEEIESPLCVKGKCTCHIEAHLDCEQAHELIAALRETWGVMETVESEIQRERQQSVEWGWELLSFETVKGWADRLKARTQP